MGIEMYLHWAQHMQMQYGVRDIFLATDSPSFLDKVKAWHGFRVMSISMPRVENHKRANWGFAGGKRAAGEVRRKPSVVQTSTRLLGCMHRAQEPPRSAALWIC